MALGWITSNEKSLTDVAVRFGDVSKSYSTEKQPFLAVDRVTLDIQCGEFFGLLGPNGAGKTTLINMLAGLVKISSGRVAVHGHDVTKEPTQVRRLLGVVPQELVFDPFLTVREVLRFQSGYFGIRQNDVWIDEVLSHLDLKSKADQNMRRLSGGMKRRVMVAQALVHRPAVIVLDEPTAGVDVELRQLLWAFVRDLNRRGHTILLTTHYLEEAEALCSRIALVKEGRLVALERTDTLVSRTSSGVLSFALASGELPAALAETNRATLPKVEIAIHSSDEAQEILTTLRGAGCRLEDLDISRPRLEDVFLELVGSGKMPGSKKHD